MKTDPRRRLPAVGKLLELPFVQELAAIHSREILTGAIRVVLDRNRRNKAGSADEHDLEKEIQIETERMSKPSLRRVINGTGIVLHTNLGRAPISLEAIESLKEVVGYTNLEFDLKTGRRGSRSDHCKEALLAATGAEDVLVVNNTAAAVMLALHSIARHQEVLISRGELVEIGGSFRIPEILEVSGAKLKEVGTTNRTRISDYAKAISKNVGAILKVHPSNFCMNGFVEETGLGELILLGKKKRLPVLFDIGSATLEQAKEVLKAGVDLLMFSGDKLLGGPQAGIILGKSKWVQKMKKDPWLRILRVDKVTISLLEHSVRNPSKSPISFILSRKVEELKKVADNIREKLMLASMGWKIDTQKTEAKAGGGSLPKEGFPSAGLIFSKNPSAVRRLEEHLRSGQPAVLGRISKDRFILDMAAILPLEEQDLVLACQSSMESVR